MKNLHCYTNFIKKMFLTRNLFVFFFRYSFRVNVCRMMSVIIVALQEYLELPIYSWLGGADKFQDYICTGLESLPIDTAEWEDYLKKDSQGSNSLLILLFCHYIGTEE